MHIAVVGTGITGACAAAWLQRDGHQITFVDPLEPGEACSFGNAGSLSPSACLPVGMPNMWKKVPSWLLDPLGPLTIRTSYLPRVAPWLIRMLRHSTPKRSPALPRRCRPCSVPSLTVTDLCLAVQMRTVSCAELAVCTSTPRAKLQTNGNGAWRCANRSA